MTVTAAWTCTPTNAAPDADTMANFYRAAKAEPMVSDFGDALFSDALDV